MKVAVVGNGQLARALRETLARTSAHTETPVAAAKLIWLAEDTAVRPDGTAALTDLSDSYASHFGDFADGAVVLLSSQVPPGFTQNLRYRYRKAHPLPEVEFAYLVENIKAGKGAKGWLEQRAFVVGLFPGPGRELPAAAIGELLAPWNRPVRYMGILDAEFTKLAINGLLATIIGYVNEIGELARLVGASPAAVEQGLRADARLYECPVRPGEPWMNEHLGRDLIYLQRVACEAGGATRLIDTVWNENQRRLRGEV